MFVVLLWFCIHTTGKLKNVPDHGQRVETIKREMFSQSVFSSGISTHFLIFPGGDCLCLGHWLRTWRPWRMLTNHRRIALSPFSTRRICSCDAKRKQESGNVIGWRSSELFRQPITLLNSRFRFASREQIRLVENGLYAFSYLLVSLCSLYSLPRWI